MTERISFLLSGLFSIKPIKKKKEGQYVMRNNVPYNILTLLFLPHLCLLLVPEFLRDHQSIESSVEYADTETSKGGVHNIRPVTR